MGHKSLWFLGFPSEHSQTFTLDVEISIRLESGLIRVYGWVLLGQCTQDVTSTAEYILEGLC